MKKNEDKILLDLFKDDIQTSKTNKWTTILTDYENYIMLTQGLIHQNPVV